MLDWNDLRHFLAIARHGSTIAAAKSLGVNQSTVQRRLCELERQLGRRLVERHPSGYRLASRSYLDSHGQPERPEDVNQHEVIGFGGLIAEHPAARWLRSVAPNARVAAICTFL